MFRAFINDFHISPRFGRSLNYACPNSAIFLLQDRNMPRSSRKAWPYRRILHALQHTRQFLALFL
jgi:hypothetical protein